MLVYRIEYVDGGIDEIDVFFRFRRGVVDGKKLKN